MALLGTLALSAVASASASAEQPVFKFMEGKAAFVGQTKTNERPEIETTEGLKLTCTSETKNGEVQGTSPSTKVTNVVETFKGCEFFHHLCQSEGAAFGTIVTEKLEGELGFITNPANEEETIGLLLKSMGTVAADFDCSTFDGEIAGSIIGKLENAKLDKKLKSTENIGLSYNAFGIRGEQELDHFFGGAVDEKILETNLTGSFAEVGFFDQGTLSPSAGGEIEISDDPS